MSDSTVFLDGGITFGIAVRADGRCVFSGTFVYTNPPDAQWRRLLKVLKRHPPEKWVCETFAYGSPTHAQRNGMVVGYVLRSLHFDASRHRVVWVRPNDWFKKVFGVKRPRREIAKQMCVAKFRHLTKQEPKTHDQAEAYLMGVAEDQ